jgi:hypothetical protein
MESGKVNTWVLLITDGTVIEYPPELYGSYQRATFEAERWAWVLSGAGWSEIERPFEGRWSIADKDIRLVPIDAEASSFIEPWIGTFWTRDGAPDPEAIVFANREDAGDWVVMPPEGAASSVPETSLPWLLSVTHRRGDDEEYSVAHRAKVVL